VPLALYVDWKNLYKRLATPGERLRGEEPKTQFGRMCAKLGITTGDLHEWRRSQRTITAARRERRN